MVGFCFVDWKRLQYHGWFVTVSCNEVEMEGDERNEVECWKIWEEREGWG